MTLKGIEKKCFVKRKKMKTTDLDIQMEEIQSIIEKIDDEETSKTLKRNNELTEKALLGMEDLENILSYILDKLSSEDNFRDLLNRGVIKCENYSDNSHSRRRFKIIVKKYPHDTTEKNELFDDNVEYFERKGNLTKLTSALLHPEVVSIIKQKHSKNEHKFLFESDNNRNVSIVISNNQCAKIFIEDGIYSQDHIGKITLEFS